MVDTARPTPLMHTARIWSLVAGGIGALTQFLVTNQVLNAGQAETLTNASASVNLLISAVSAVITGGLAVAAAFGTAKQGQDKVTPNESPRDEQGRILVPLAPDTSAVVTGSP